MARKHHSNDISMKAIIYKQNTKDKGVQREALYFLGICIYVREYPVYKPTPQRPIGFVQFPTEAPSWVEDEEYYDEDKHHKQ